MIAIADSALCARAMAGEEAFLTHRDSIAEDPATMAA
jgi:hypothetical protein